MKSAIQSKVKAAIETLISTQQFSPAASEVNIQIERTRDPSHGDFACNVAMQLARVLGQNPRQIAETLVATLADDEFEKIEIAGPGFINFTLSNNRYADLLQQIISAQDKFGQAQEKTGQRILIEFVSANPTGPLHVGHGRGAAYGATLANLLRSVGHEVDCEYYVNDAGRQMDILGTSVYLRYLELCGQEFNYPSNAYQAQYVKDIAKTIYDHKGSSFNAPDDFFTQLVIDNYPQFMVELNTHTTQLADCQQRLNAEDKKQIIILKATLDDAKTQLEQQIDTLIARSKAHLGEKNYALFFTAALNTIRDDIEADLGDFGVTFQRWFSEKSLYDEGKITAAIQILKAQGYIYEQNGAQWFKSTEFGDDKDRVVQRENGAYTYFASDIGYHHDKYVRGYNKLIDIFGSDHHGYMARVRAALQALGHNPQKLQIDLVQFAVLYKEGEKMPMSTRSGNYVTLRDLRQMVGNSAARYFYVARKPSQHMDFDLDLAVKNSKDNPLYYIQYAHARICRLFERASEKGIIINNEEALTQINQLTLEHEVELLRQLEKYSDVVINAANDCAPHHITNYLKDLATALHSYYDSGLVKFLAQDRLQQSRLLLLQGVRQVLNNGLSLSGVNAPEVM